MNRLGWTYAARWRANACLIHVLASWPLAVGTATARRASRRRIDTARLQRAERQSAPAANVFCGRATISVRSNDTQVTC